MKKESLPYQHILPDSHQMINIHMKGSFVRKDIKFFLLNNQNQNFKYMSQCN
jgi:hypothetical protein